MRRGTQFINFRSSMAIVISLIMIICQINIADVLAYENPADNFDLYQDIDIQLGHSDWIEKEDSRNEYLTEDVLTVDVEVTDFTVDDESLIDVYSDLDGWDIYGKKAGKTTANISYDYSYINGDGQEISGSNQEEFNIFVREYGVSLRIDSPSNTILPGERIRLVASVKKAVYNDNEEDYEYIDVTDDVDLQLETFENYSYDNGGAIDENYAIMDTPEQNGNRWEIYAKELDGVDSNKREGEATYWAIVKVGNEVVAESDSEWINVKNKFYVIHNDGDFDAGGTNNPRELLVGHTINACCSGDAAEFEIWEKKYGQADVLLDVDNADVSELRFSDFDWGMFDYKDDEDGNTIGLKVVNDYDVDLPWEDTIELSVKIDDVCYKNKVPVKVNGYKMKYEGENIKYFNDGSSGSIVFLSSDAINSTSNEIKIKACLSSDSINNSDYVTNYELGYYDEDYDYIVITSDAGVIVDSEYYFLSSDALRHLYDKYKNSNEDACNLILTTKALELSGDATGDGVYATDKYTIFIRESTLFEYTYDEDFAVLPGDRISIEKEGESYFNNESVDWDYANYSITGAPTISSDADNWYTIQNEDDVWLVKISSSADAINKRATVSFNYKIEDSDIERKHSFEINVADKMLRVDCEKDYTQMIFGSKSILSPVVYYSYYDSGSGENICKKYPKDTIEGLDISLERMYTEYDEENEGNSPYGGYTKAEKSGNKWTITAISPAEYGQNTPYSGSDYYKLTATLGDLTASYENIDFWVGSEYFEIEKENGDLKLNVLSDKTIKLSDFVLYKHYLIDSMTNDSWEGKELVTSVNKEFEDYKENIFDINESGEVLTVKDSITNFPFDTFVGVIIETAEDEFYKNFDFSIVNEQGPTPGGGTGGGTGGEGQDPYVWQTDGRLCFTAEEANSKIRLIKVGSPNEIKMGFLTSSGDGYYKDYVISSESDYINLSSDGNKVWFKSISGDASSWFSKNNENYYKFETTGKISASGNIMSLLDCNVQLDTIPCEYCFTSLFEGCTSLTSAPELPATSLKNYCYKDMFKGCSQIKSLKVGFSQVGNENYFEGWLEGTASGDSGILNVPAANSMTKVQLKLPSNWSINKESQEQGQGGGNGGAAEPEDSKSTNIDVVSSISTSNQKGKLVESVDLIGKLSDLIKNAADSKAKEVTINAKSGKNVDEVDVIIPAEDFGKLGQLDINDAVISTSVCDFRIDKQALSEIAKQAPIGSNLSIEAVEIQSNKKSQAEYELKITAGNKTISNFNGGKIMVTVNVPSELQGKTVSCLYKDKKGKYSEVQVVNSIGSGTKISFITNHFSTYLVLPYSEATKKLLKQSKVVQNRIKALKGKKIRVSFKKLSLGNMVSADAVKYTVQRSIKKNFKKAVKNRTITSKESTIKFTDSNKLKKGTKYYYRIRATVVLEDGTKANSKWSATNYIKCK